MDDITTRLFAYFSGELPDPAMAAQLDENFDLIEHGVIDSLSMMKTIIFLEREFGLRMYELDVEMEDFNNIGKIAAFIRQHQPQNSPS